MKKDEIDNIALSDAKYIYQHRIDALNTIPTDDTIKVKVRAYLRARSLSPLECIDQIGKSKSSQPKHRTF